LKPSKKQKVSKQELRSTLQASRLEARESNGTKKLTGYAVVFNSPASIGGQFNESIAPGAFTRTLAEDDQVLLRDHQSELLLGRRSAGTLKLSQDAIGLAFTVTLPDTALAQDTYENVRIGNLKGCSFGFIVRDDDWTKGSDGSLNRVINDVQLLEITLTAFPAYSSTSIAISRSLRKLKSNEFNLDLDDDGLDGFDDLDGSDDSDDDEDSEDRCNCSCPECRAAHPVTDNRSKKAVKSSKAANRQLLALRRL
jgi:HK97 family phage prohead protease